MVSFMEKKVVLCILKPKREQRQSTMLRHMIKYLSVSPKALVIAGVPWPKWKGSP